MDKIINGLFPGKLEPTEVVAGCIEVYEGVWPNAEQTVEKLEELIENKNSGVYWKQAETIGSGVYQDIRTNKLMDLSYLSGLTTNGLLQNIHNQFYMLLLATTIGYAKRYHISENLFHEQYQLLKYSSGEEYGHHYDGPSNTKRIISAVCYLNDRYEGGEIEFPFFDVKYRPVPGSLLLFPSNFAYRHRSVPIISGTKYALVTWIRDRE